MLEIKGLGVSYGMHRALTDVSASVGAGEVVVILGANGAGKSSLLRAIAGVCEGAATGSVEFRGEEILGLSADVIVGRGIAFVPEGRGIFGELSVEENLKLGAFNERARPQKQGNLERVLQLFPKLAERRRQVARTMSGGEQQMVAIGRALMSAPDILMLDEPSLGLSPLLCKELFQTIARVRDTGTSVLLVEQNARQSLAIADRGYLIENGTIKGHDSAEALRRDPAIQKAYLGGGAGRVGASPGLLSAGSDIHDGNSKSGGATMSEKKHFIKPGGLAGAGRTQRADQLAGESVAAIVARADAGVAGHARSATAGRAADQSAPAAQIPAAHSPSMPRPALAPVRPARMPAADSRDVPGRSPEVARLIAQLEAAAAAARTNAGHGSSDNGGTGRPERSERSESLVYRSWRQSGAHRSDVSVSGKSKE